MLNKVQIIGHLGRDPETHATKSGQSIATLSIATTKKWRDKATGEIKELTEWHRVVIFAEKLAQVAENYLRKGSKAFVEGELRTRKWTDQNEIERWSTEIVVGQYGGKLILLDKREGAGMATAHQAGQEEDLDDEIPF